MRLLVLWNTAGVFTPIAKWMTEQGHEVRIVMNSQFDPFELSSSSDYAVMVNSPKEYYLECMRQIRQFKPNVIHANSIKSLVIARLFSMRTPIVFTYHGTDIRRRVKTRRRFGLMHTLRHYMMHPRDLFLAVSQIVKGIDGHRPRILLLETTTRCNANCSYCGRTGRGQDMPLEILKSIIDAAPWAKGVILARRGEALMYPHILEAVKYAKRAGKYVMFTTNGQLLDQDMAESLLALRVDAIRFSIDDYDADRFNSTRRGLSLEVIEQNLENFVALRNRIAAKTQITIRATVGPWNKDRINQVRDYWLKKGVDGFRARCVMNVPLASETQNLPFVDHPPVTCTQVSDCLNVSHDGTVPICCNDWHDLYRVGTIDTDTTGKDLVEIYNSAKFRRLRLNMLLGNENIPSICGPCRKSWRGESC